MNFLGIDTSLSYLSLGLVSDLPEQKIIAETSWYLPKRQLTEVVPKIKRLLEDNNLKIEDLNGIGITIGPGSFTGLRLGLATAKTLAQFLKIKIVGLNTLEIIARNIPPTTYLVCPLLDAKMNYVYTAVFRYKNYSLRAQIKEVNLEDTNLERLTENLVLDLKGLKELINQFNQPIIFLGNGILPYVLEIKRAISSPIYFAPSFFWYPRAGMVAFIAADMIKEGKEDDIFSLQPLYLRRPQAEVRLEKNG